MSRPTEVSLNFKQKKAVLSAFKKTKNARKIAKTLSVPHRHVMAFLESQQLAKYSEGSYK